MSGSRRELVAVSAGRQRAGRHAVGPGLALLAAAALACSGRAAPPGPVHLTTAAVGANTRLTLVAEPGVMVNARVAPALELADGTVLRFGSARLTPDSAYFAEPPSALLAGRHGRVHGRLRASVCRVDERLCQAVALDL